MSYLRFCRNRLGPVAVFVVSSPVLRLREYIFFRALLFRLENRVFGTIFPKLHCQSTLVLTLLPGYEL